ncbi:MAG: hypothetical protein JSR45_18005 [Proteobacteria bacterium]|nr:hypothetical protein [Pseudomonadota bacterium]
MTIFEVTPEEISELNDADLRELVGRLAEQEVTLQGLSSASVTYGGRQEAKDGGIDVRIDLESPISGYVPTAKTGFQVKAQEYGDADIQKEMRPKGVLRPAIVELGAAGGSYIIVSSKSAVSDLALRARRNAMAAAIADQPTAASLYLDFYDRRRLATWVNHHPGLVTWVKSHLDKPLAGWKPFGDWSSSPGNDSEEYILGDEFRIVGQSISGPGLSTVDGINSIRDTLAIPRGAVRLTGLSGVGKTRFVQALFDARVGSNALSPDLAVYTDVADHPNPSPLELAVRLINLGQRCVLVVDNCGAELHRKLVALIQHVNGKLSFISIEYDIQEDEPEGTEVFRLESASTEVIQRILKRRNSHLTAPEVQAIASFSEGNFRVALALAQTSKRGSSVANLKDGDLFKRLFEQKHEENPALLRAARASALVYSFDGETLAGPDAELPLLAELAGQTPEHFYAHIAELRRRQLIQCRSRWRALLPHALAHRLAKEALEEIPASNLLDALTSSRTPARLTRSFSRRLGYLHDSTGAQIVVQNWLSEGGWLAALPDLNPLGLSIFENVSPVDPPAALQAIRRCAPQLQKDGDATLRRKLVHILRAISYDPELFSEAALVLSSFAGDQEESNNLGDAVNVFKSLFYLYLSGTMAPAAQRAELLKQLAVNGSPRQKAFVLHGLSAMLKTSHFSSSYGFEFGARRRGYGLQPTTGADVFNWYRTVLNLCGYLDADSELGPKVRHMVAREFAPLIRTLGLFEELASLAKRFAKNGGWPEGWVAVRRASAEAKRNKNRKLVKELADILALLSPSSIQDRIAVYLGAPDWSTLDLADVDYSDANKFEKARLAAEKACADIGKDLASNLDELVSALPALFKAESLRIWNVGIAVGESIGGKSKGWNIIAREFIERSAENGAFLAAYLKGVRQVDADAAEDILDSVLSNEALHPQFVRLQAAAGFGGRAYERLELALARDTVPVRTFRYLSYSQQSISAAENRRILAAVAKKDGGWSVAMDVLADRLHAVSAGRLEITDEDVDLGRSLLEAPQLGVVSNHEAYEIAMVARACLTPADAVIAEHICLEIINTLQSHRVNVWDYGHLLDVIAERFPRTLLDTFAGDGPEAPYDRRHLLDDLRMFHADPLEKVPPTVLFEWANEDPGQRFAALAQVIRLWRKTGATQEGPSAIDDDASAALEWTPNAWRIIRSAPEPEPVLRAVQERLEPRSWSGSRADLVMARRTLVEQLVDDEKPEIALWARSAVAFLDEQIAHDREWEARHRSDRDERFEY